MLLPMLFAAGLGICALFGAALCRRKPSDSARPRAFSCLLAFLAFFAVFLCLARYRAEAQGKMVPVQRLDGQEVRLRGTVRDYPQEAYHKYYYRIKVERVTRNGRREDLPEFTARISTWQALECQPWDTVECTVKLSSFSEAILPFSGRNSYWADGVALGGYLSDYSDVRVVPRTDSPPGKLFLELRHFLGRSLERTLPGEEAALIRAMLLGEKDKLSQQAYGDFRTIGVSHLLVVSGLHLSVLAGFLSQALGRIIRGKRWLKNLFTAMAVLFFLTLIGFPVSALRSGAMFLLYLVADSLGLEADGVNSLGAAVLVICLWNPFSGGDLSLALSVFSTLGILLLAGPIAQFLLRPARGRKRLRRLLSPAAECLGIAFSALLFTLPIQLLVFGGFSLIGPLANLLLMFPCTFLLETAFLGLLFSPAPLAALGKPFLFCAGWLARWVLGTAQRLAGFPAAFLSLSGAGPLLALALLAALLGVVFLLGNTRTAGCVAAAAALVLYSVGWAFGGPGPGQSTVTIAAAGDSSCVAVLRDGRAAVLALGGFRTGAALSLLEENNVSRVEALCLPVRDQDAREAAVHLLEARGAKLLVLPASAYLGRDLALAGEKAGRLLLEEGDSFSVLDGVTVTSTQNMGRLEFSVNGVSVMVETAPSGEGRCHVLFTTQPDSRINSSFTVLQKDDILEQKTGVPSIAPGCYLVPGEDGLYVDLLPGGTVKIRGESLCLRSEKAN